MAGAMILTNEIYGRMSTGVVFPLSSDVWFVFIERRPEAVYRPLSPWIAFVLPVGREKSTSQATKVIPSHWETGFVPRTALGKRLIALRTKAVTAGMRLLTEEEVLVEVKRRRGEIADDETDLH